MITIRKYRVQDIVPAMEIWNEVVRDGIAFPQDEELASLTISLTQELQRITVQENL